MNTEKGGTEDVRTLVSDTASPTRSMDSRIGSFLSEAQSSFQQQRKYQMDSFSDMMKDIRQESHDMIERMEQNFSKLMDRTRPEPPMFASSRLTDHPCLACI